MEQVCGFSADHPSGDISLQMVSRKWPESGKSTDFAWRCLSFTPFVFRPDLNSAVQRIHEPRVHPIANVETGPHEYV